MLMVAIVYDLVADFQVTYLFTFLQVTYWKKQWNKALTL